MFLKNHSFTGACLFAAGLAMLTASASAVPISVSLPGITQYDGWADLTTANYPGYGSFPGASPWPGPIGSNQAGSGDANLSKTAGNAFPAGEAIYFGGFSSTPNTFGGSLGFTDATPVANLETVVFQVEIGQAFGYDFFNDLLPTLSYNGGSQNLAADYSAIVDQYQNGTFTDPISGLDEPVYVTTYLLQWDLSSLVGISSFAVNVSAVQHSQLYAAQLDQSDTFESLASSPTVPEPATAMLCLLGSLALASRRRCHA